MISRKLIKAVVPHALRKHESRWGKLRDEDDIEDFLFYLPKTVKRKKRGKQT
tara:strand:- start:992 stop:1147 length:156 start_codon:yes stop_codon:yes gene_type:complete